MSEARVLELRNYEFVPDQCRRLLAGLKKTFPNATFRIDLEREKCVYARGAGDPTNIDRIRYFCDGFRAGT